MASWRGLGRGLTAAGKGLTGISGLLSNLADRKAEEERYETSLQTQRASIGQSFLEGEEAGWKTGRTVDESVARLEEAMPWLEGAALNDRVEDLRRSYTAHQEQARGLWLAQTEEELRDAKTESQVRGIVDSSRSAAKAIGLDPGRTAAQFFQEIEYGAPSVTGKAEKWVPGTPLPKPGELRVTGGPSEQTAMETAMQKIQIAGRRQIGNIEDERVRARQIKRLENIEDYADRLPSEMTRERALQVIRNTRIIEINGVPVPISKEKFDWLFENDPYNLRMHIRSPQDYAREAAGDIVVMEEALGVELPEAFVQAYVRNDATMTVDGNQRPVNELLDSYLSEVQARVMKTAFWEIYTNRENGIGKQIQDAFQKALEVPPLKPGEAGFDLEGQAAQEALAKMIEAGDSAAAEWLSRPAMQNPDLVRAYMATAYTASQLVSEMAERAMELYGADVGSAMAQETFRKQVSPEIYMIFESMDRAGMFGTASTEEAIRTRTTGGDREPAGDPLLYWPPEPPPVLRGEYDMPTIGGVNQGRTVGSPPPQAEFNVGLPEGRPPSRARSEWGRQPPSWFKPDRYR